MGRLQHLAGIERVGVGVVVVETGCDLLEDSGGRFAQRNCGGRGEMREAFVQSALGFGEEFEEFV
jgi:hypothetical protein